MPSYANEQKRFSKKRGRWEKVKKEEAFDYSSIDRKAWGLLISFFRFYPDYFYDLIRDKNAPYGLELPQRMMLRIQARYRRTYITGARGLTKTFIIFLSKLHDGVFYPNEKIRYFAPSQKQSASLASTAFSAVEQCYPIMTNYWKVNHNRSDMFMISTDYGSEFSMYTTRGDNYGNLIAEEMCQSGADGFDFEKFEADIKKGHRLIRMVNGEKDRTRIQLKFNCISNASTRQNKAYVVYRQVALKQMLFGDKYDGYCLDIPWQVALLCRLRDIAYYKDERSTTFGEIWQREHDALYTGTGENPMLSDEILSKSKKIAVMENRHCGDPNCIYVVAHDVSYEEGQKNAKCADVVWKCTRYTNPTKRDKYRKQAVFVDSYPPPATEALQAQRLRDLWWRFSSEKSENATYIVVDARAVGKTVVQELMKPSFDGTPNLSCYNGEYGEIAQPHAMPIIYPLKATRAGGTDDEGAMILYLQREWEQQNIEIPITNVLDGVEAYKKYHGIKDTFNDGKIAQMYKQVEGWCEEMQNLQVKDGKKEVRKSKGIQRDRHSAAKYGLRFISLLEDLIVKEEYKAKSSWSAEIEKYNSQPHYIGSTQSNTRSRLLGLRKR